MILVILLATLLPLLYVAVGGVVFIRVLRARLDLCEKCQRRRAGSNSYLDACYGHDGAYLAAVSASVLWPIAIFAVLPALWADPHRNRIKVDRLQTRIAELEREAGIR